MRRRTFLGGALAAGMLALVLAGGTLAQEDDQVSPAGIQPVPAESDALAAAPALFLRVTDPPGELEVPISTTSVALRGQTLPRAIVSVDGLLVTVDDQGGFASALALDEGANAIDVVASTEDGSVLDTTIVVIRGDE